MCGYSIDCVQIDGGVEEHFKTYTSQWAHCPHRPYKWVGKSVKAFCISTRNRCYHIVPKLWTLYAMFMSIQLFRHGFLPFKNQVDKLLEAKVGRQHCVYYRFQGRWPSECVKLVGISRLPSVPITLTYWFYHTINNDKLQHLILIISWNSSKWMKQVFFKETSSILPRNI